MTNRAWMGDAVRVVVEPDRGTVDSEVSVQIIVDVERDDIPDGTTITISLLGPHAWPTLLGPDEAPAVGQRSPVSVEFPGHMSGRFEVDNRALRRAIILRPAKALRRGDRIRVRLGDDRGLAHLPPFDCRIPLAVFLVPPGGPSMEMPDPPAFQVVSGGAAAVRLFVASQAGVGTPTWLHLRLVDQFGNTASDFMGTVTLTTSDREAECVRTIPFGAEHQGIRRLPAGVTWKTPGIQRVRAAVGASNLQAVSNPAEVLVSLDGAPRLAWGDFHGHTYLSDGLEGPEFYYRYARDVEALDFSGISDHSHGHREAWEDDPVLQDDSAGLAFRDGTPASKYPHWPSRLTRWAETKRAAAEYHDPGRFVAFLGYEWNAGQVIQGLNVGAKCVYFPGGAGPMLTYFDADAADPERLWQVLRPTGAITIPHHTAYPLNELPPGVDWRYHDPVMQPVVEIYSKHGNSECYGNLRSPAKVQKGNFVQDALARGHRIGIIAGSDSHLSRPGSDCVEYEKGYYRQGGLAAVYTEALTRGAILDALRARRCYGTTNGRILLRFDVDGHQIGDACTASPSEIAAREVHVFVAGTAALRTVEIIRNNEAVHSWSSDAMDGTFAWRDDRPLLGSSYYYARIVQTDGEMAWSSPVWFDLPADR